MTKEASPLHNPQGKWAIEAFDFLRLFRRIGRSFLGLLFLEIGWTAYVILLDRIISSKPAAPTVSFPWPINGNATVIISSNRLLLLGSFFIAVAWGLYSGFHQYLLAILWWVVKPIIFITFTVIAVVLFLVNVVLFPITWTMEIRNIRRWKRENHTKLRKVQKKCVAAVRQPPSKWRQQKSSIQKRVNATVRQQILPADKWIVMNKTRPAIGGLLTRMYSFAVIGFAPLASYSYEEDLQAAKAPVQVFAWAITKVRIHLRGVEALDWIRFKFLPVHFLVSTPEKAEFVRRLFKLDVLLWGSYSTSEPKTIWLNIQQNLRPRSTDASDSDTDRSFDFDLFPLFMELDAPAVALSQDDPVEAHTLLLIVIVLILQNRWNAKSESRKSFDRLYSLHRRIPDITNRLVYDAFLSITEKRLTSDFLPPTNVVLTTIIGQWLGHQLNTRSSTAMTSKFLGTLHGIAKRCTELMPGQAEHFYRLGAYNCLLDDKVGARESFRKGGTLESTSQVNPVHDQVLFDLSLDDAVGEVGYKQRFALAKAAAHAARALNNRDDYTMDRIIEVLNKHKPFFDRERLEIKLIREMIESERKKLGGTR